MRLYGAGDNAFGQISSSAQEFCVTRPRLIANEARRILHVTQSQCIYETQEGEYVLLGMPLEHMIDFRNVKTLLGKDEVRAYIDKQDRLCLLNGIEMETGCSAAAMNGHGHFCLYRQHRGFTPEFLRSKHGAKELAWMSEIGAGHSRSWLPASSESREVYICAGASHFIVVSTDPTDVSTIGSDNRFGQLSSNVRSQQGAERRKVEFFTEDMKILARPGQVDAGDLHCAVIESGSSALYVWGDDSKGQTGGFADGGEPALIDLPDEADASYVACGAHHTVVVADGKAFVTGANDYGQLGLGDTESRHAFTQCESFEGSKVVQVHCGRYTTYWLLDD